LFFFIKSEKLAAIGEMAAGVAHEINNSLTIIKCLSDMLIHKINDPNSDRESWIKDLKSIENKVDRISKIINGLRLYSRNAEKTAKSKAS
jgi:C4-dicarboxylate-specific signal transduction histidine kinase